VPVYLMCVNFREVADRRARHNVFFRISPAEVAQMRAVMEPMMTWRRGAGAETAALSADPLHLQELSELPRPSP
jgi:hypothetical protein